MARATGYLFVDAFITIIRMERKLSDISLCCDHASRTHRFQAVETCRPHKFPQSKVDTQRDECRAEATDASSKKCGLGLLCAQRHYQIHQHHERHNCQKRLNVSASLSCFFERTRFGLEPIRHCDSILRFEVAKRIRNIPTSSPRKSRRICNPFESSLSSTTWFALPSQTASAEEMSMSLSLREDRATSITTSMAE